MSNRAPDRYALPPELGNRDTTMWVAGKPFFLASAVKYIWRGWEHADDLGKAIDCLETAYVHEAEEGDSLDLMWHDLARIKRGFGSREEALMSLAMRSPSVDRVGIRCCIRDVSERLQELKGEKG